MTFVFPILLGGLGLLAVPILIHLIFRQKPRTLKFPAFRFLMKRSRTNLRKLQLRHLLLLAMRMLLLALICLALARPKVSGDLLGLQTDQPVAIVLVFDTSYSMQYKNTAGKNRLDEAREQALRLLETLHPKSQVIVLDTAEPAGAASWSKREEAMAQIGTLGLRHDNYPVTRRLEDAYQIFSKLAHATDDEIGRRLPRVLCVFADRTEACWDGQHLVHLQTLADSIPPPLERLRGIQGSIPAKIALLKELRQQLPLAESQDYPEQALIASWDELYQKIPAASWDTYPGQDWTKLISQTCSRSRELFGKLQALDATALAQAQKDFRQKILDSVTTGLRELQGVSPFFMDVGVDDAVDLGIVTVDLLPEGSMDFRHTFAPGERFKAQVLVQATGGDFNTTLIGEINGKKLPTQPISALKGGEGKQYYFQINPDELQLQPGFHHLHVKVGGGDQMAFNNQRFATFLIRPPRRILIITDEPKTAERFRQAVAVNTKVQFECKVQSTEKNLEDISKPGPSALLKYHAVYLLNVAQPNEKLWDHLKAFVDQGGNIGVIPGGENLDLKAYAGKTARALLPGELQGIIKAKPEKDEPGKLDPGAVWDWGDETIYQHPFLNTFGAWKRLGQPDFILFPRWVYYFRKVQPHAKGSTVLVKYKSTQPQAHQQPALLERDFGKGRGRVVLLTTRLDFPTDPPWNNYWTKDTFWIVVFPGELSIYLAGDLERLKLNFITGRGVPAVSIPSGVNDPSFNLKGPIVQDAILRPNEGNELLFWKAVVPGNYSVEDSIPETIGAFSVNTPPEEGSLKRVPAVDIEALFGKESLRSFKPGDTLFDVLGELLSRPEEILPILMVALLLLLALENLLANLFYRREPQTQESGGAT